MALTILTKATLHIKDEKRSVAPKYDASGTVLLRDGRLVVIEVPPETAVEFEDEDEARAIVERHGGEETDLPPRISVPAHRGDAVSEAVIPLAALLAAEKGGDDDEAPAPKGRKAAA